jgi:hypothetical protein
MATDDFDDAWAALGRDTSKTEEDSGERPRSTFWIGLTTRGKDLLVPRVAVQLAATENAQTLDLNWPPSPRFLNVTGYAFYTRDQGGNRLLQEELFEAQQLQEGNVLHLIITVYLYRGHPMWRYLPQP